MEKNSKGTVTIKLEEYDRLMSVSRKYNDNAITVDLGMFSSVKVMNPTEAIQKVNDAWEAKYKDLEKNQKLETFKSIINGGLEKVMDAEEMRRKSLQKRKAKIDDWLCIFIGALAGIIITTLTYKLI